MLRYRAEKCQPGVKQCEFCAQFGKKVTNGSYMTLQGTFFILDTHCVPPFNDKPLCMRLTISIKANCSTSLKGFGLYYHHKMLCHNAVELNYKFILHCKNFNMSSSPLYCKKLPLLFSHTLYVFLKLVPYQFHFLQLLGKPPLFL